tara:strand:- start:3524 stop:3841 length:318 start_codon:yes stop_codon:yes gene_type:complete
LIVLSPPSSFQCEGDKLDITIYNNLNGDYLIASDLETLDEGAFVLIKWRDEQIMIPRTFNKNEISFSDRKWWWSYKEANKPVILSEPIFRKRMRNGTISNFSCTS